MDGITVWPHTSQFDVDGTRVYQDWLRNDHPREIAYRGAVQALGNRSEISHVLDAGTGTGVWAIAAASVLPRARVDAIDIQESNTKTASQIIVAFPTLESRVKFTVADINNFSPGKKYDAIITELDGGLGGNEGAKKAFQSLQALLTPGGIIIPEKITTYVAPICLEGVNKTLPNTEASPFLQNRRIIIDDPFSCYYLIYGVNSSHILADSQIIESFETKSCRNKGYRKKFDFRASRNAEVTGFLIWFEHILIGDIRFTNRFDHPVTSWGQAYFPVRQIAVSEGDNITLSFSEIITRSGPLPHYTWQVEKNGSKLRIYSNKENQQRRR